MSNQLKTLSKVQLEALISKTISEYLDEDVNCNVSNLDTPNIDKEENIGHHNKRLMHFEVDLSYRE